MQLVIADTGPINYLLLIEQIHILPVLFERVILPVAVKEELSRAKAPVVVQQWIASPPAWIEVREVLRGKGALRRLDPGEEAAIILALEINADVLLMDDRAGVVVARHMGLNVSGTLGVLAMASRRGLVDLAAAFDRLKRTNFYCPRELMDQLLKEASGSGR